MNLVARIGDVVVTPPLGDTLLAGITRDSVLTLLREQGVPIEERPLSLDEVLSAHRRGTLREVFGTGTAAVVAPVGEIAFEGGSISIAPAPGGVSERLGELVRAIQRGDHPDRHRWLDPVGE